MPFPLPVPPYPYDDETRAIIAGYLLHHRAGTLDALRSVGHPIAGQTEGWAEGNYHYYQAAESYSRFLLYWLGYPVQRNQMYEPPAD